MRKNKQADMTSATTTRPHTKAETASPIETLDMRVPFCLWLRVIGAGSSRSVITTTEVLYG